MLPVTYIGLTELLTEVLALIDIGLPLSFLISTSGIEAILSEGIEVMPAMFP